MKDLVTQIESAQEAVRLRWSSTPIAGIILGSGLGNLAEEIDVEETIDYQEIPHFPQVSALGHRGRLVCGKLESKPVIAFQGRFHLYEGNTPQEASLPARLTRALGAEVLVVSNAAGGCNPEYVVGDVMVIRDQINFMFANPLVGINEDSLGPRFPDMSAPYDSEFQELARDVARREGFLLREGVYASMLGPTYETRAEYRMVRVLGGDAVGMSTVPEVLAARHAEMRVLGLSTITNVGSPDILTETTGHDVLEAASLAANKLTRIVRGLVVTL